MSANSVLGDLSLSDLTTKTTTYNRQTTDISYVQMHTLGYKIKSLTLLKQIKFTKQTHTKLASDSTSLEPLEAATHSSMITITLVLCRGVFICSVGLGFRVSLGIVKVRLG